MLAAIPRIPVQIPVKSNTGREYRLFTNFCNVLLPKEQVTYNKYAIISMQREVADALMSFDFGYLYVGKNTSITMETKYSERMYWYIKGNLSNHGVTITTLEFRKMLGLEDKYKNFNALEKNVLETSQLEIKKKFDKDEIECYFTYTKIYNHRAKRGEPDAIRFSIYEGNNTLEEKISKVVQNQQDIISEMLRKDLGLSDRLTSLIIKRVTNENAEALKNEIIKIKMNLDAKEEDKEVVRNKTAYIVTSLNTFFTNFKKGGGEAPKSSTKPKENKDYRQGWNKVVQEMYAVLPQEDADTLFRNTKFLGYDPATGILSTTLDMPAYNLLRSGYINKLAEYLRKYLDKDFKRIDPKKC